MEAVEERNGGVRTAVTGRLRASLGPAGSLGCLCGGPAEAREWAVHTTYQNGVLPATRSSQQLEMEMESVKTHRDSFYEMS